MKLANQRLAFELGTRK
ncbi:hypothetical protein Goari_021741 [Gossypium aridum]|uniref:Uncharacterized protein n=1 Tax=Gossypium aridum TaxID=34290 RepID=A0A7J8YFU6_GOSAI|nr:hypothetical protein [Gossypium aridum]